MGMFGYVILIVSGATFLGILAGLLMHKIIGLYIEGNISGLQCVVIAGLFLGFLIIFITVPSMTARVLMGIIFVILLIFMPFLGRLLTKQENRRFYDSRIEEYRNVIIADPRNMAARSRLAQSLYKEGRLDEAIQELSEYVRLAPQDQAEVYQLKQLMSEREERKSSPITCPSCGYKNPPDRTHCESCEGHLSLTSELKKWLAKGGLRQIAISFAISMAVITVVLLGLSKLSVIGKILVIALFLFIVLLLQVMRYYRELQ